MATQIFVNLPVKDLDKSKKFFTDIGFTINPQFTDDKAACVVISEDIYAMILREEFFKTFIPKEEIADATKSTEVLVAACRKPIEQFIGLFLTVCTYGNRYI